LGVGRRVKRRVGTELKTKKKTWERGGGKTLVAR